MSCEVVKQKIKKNESFHQVIYGWDVNQGPPEILGVNDFGPIPGPMFSIHKNTFQAISPVVATPTSHSANNFFATSLPPVIDDLWILEESASITFQLKTLFCMNVQITLEAAGVNSQGGDAEIEVYVEYTSDSAPKTQLAYSMNINDTMSSYTFELEAKYFAPCALSLEAGDNVNSIVLKTGSSSSARLKSLSIQTDSKDVEVKGQWVLAQDGEGTLEPGANSNVTCTFTKGTHSSKSTCVSVTNSLNVAGGLSSSLGLKGLLKALSFSINAAYSKSTTHSSTSSISLHESTSISRSIGISPEQSTLSYQIWQLCLFFCVDNESIDLLLDSPYIEEQSTKTSNQSYISEIL